MLKDPVARRVYAREQLIKAGPMTGTAVQDIVALEDSLTHATRADVYGCVPIQNRTILELTSPEFE